MFHRVLPLILFLLPTADAGEPCGGIATFADAKKPRREIFISPDGNNFQGDGSRNAPFQTIRRAVDKLQAGDAIRLLPGVYTNSVYLEKISGAEDAPVWIGGEPGKSRPIFDGAGIHLSRANFVVLENLEVRGAKGNGINCDDGGEFANSNATRHVIFRNLLIHDTGTGGNQDGLKISGLNDYFVLDCEFDRISVGGSGIDHVGCHHGLITGCTFREGGNSIQCKGGSEDIEIRGCRFMNPGDRAINIGGSTGLTLFRPPISTNTPNFESKNIRVFANVFQGGSVTPVAFVGTADSIVANNTILDPHRWIVRILQETVSNDRYKFVACGHNRFVNNLIYFDGSELSVAVNVGLNTDPGSFEFANNLWFDHHHPEKSRPQLPVSESNAIYGEDPQLGNVNSNSFNFAPTRNSPAAAKGEPIQTLKSDFDGNCFANPPAIGAFEAAR